jgi:hypothetical protein
MQVQENVKLPTFTWTVDRRSGGAANKPGGGSSPPPPPIPSQQKISARTASLMEEFLRDDKGRATRNASYAHAGVLKQDTTRRLMKDYSPNVSLSYGMLDPLNLLDEVEPIPLAEMKIRPGPIYYGRSSPLPIPTSPTTAPESPEDEKKKSAPSPAPSSPKKPPAATGGGLPMPAEAVETAAALAARAPPPPQVRVVPGAVQSASEQKSRYGFGAGHEVPSTSAAPPPPRCVRAVTAPAAIKSRSATPTTGAATRQNAGPAYERKKERAKHARVKLNGAIERLSTAIHVAGTQTRERAVAINEQQWDDRQHLLGVMNRCVSIADQAKKWDRPAFVGAAATIIANLQEQCETLFGQVESLRERLEDGKTSGGHAHRHARPADSAESPSPPKRPRINGTRELLRKRSSLLSTDDDSVSSTVSFDSSVVVEPKVMERLGAFLDAQSLVRCMQASKLWKGVFSRDVPWEQLCVARFGPTHVRQWRAKLEDEEGEEATSTVRSSVLYRTMDAANVTPAFRRDGLVPLGEARVAGKVSAWTFLVERSNGETARSVRRKPDAPGSGAYASTPVVTLWTVIQNTGNHDEPVIIRDQPLSVDASTRRRGEQLKEIDWDGRFQKRILKLDGTPINNAGQSVLPGPNATGSRQELCRLKMFEAVVLEMNIHAKGCSTTSKFIQRSNYVRVLVQIRNATTVPLVIPFPRDAPVFNTL